MISVPAANAFPPDTHGVRKAAFRALGTACELQFTARDDAQARTFVGAALVWLEGFEARFSRFRSDSLVSRVNAFAGVDWVPVDQEMERLLQMADGLYFLSEGLMDPTLLPLLKVWDWKTARTQLPSAEAVEQARQRTGWKKVQRRPGAVFLPERGMGLDFGGFGKEYAVDRLAQIARQHGLADCLVDLGRDLYALGTGGKFPFWHVGVENGRQPGTCWTGLGLRDQAVAASGDYARSFLLNGVRYGHILDPRTGWPAAKGVRAVTVVAPTCVEAGVYSTTACILGPADGLAMVSRARGVEACVQTDCDIQSSPGFNRLQVKAA